VRCARSAVSTPPHLAQLARFSLPNTSPLGPCQGFAEIAHAESFWATLKVESTTGARGQRARPVCARVLLKSRMLNRFGPQ
jgi:hypothetical protein